MKIKLKGGAIFPHLKDRKGTIEIRAVATWVIDEELFSSFIDCQKDLDKIPYWCDTLTILFDDGAYVELPLETFKQMFKVIPEGPMTNAIYGDK